MKVRHIENSLIPKVLKVEAITLFPFVLYAGKACERVMSHELVHVCQIKDVGILRFYLSYLLEYLSYRVRGDSQVVAYNKISYEKQAYKLQKDV